MKKYLSKFAHYTIDIIGFYLKKVEAMARKKAAKKKKK
jgi:hypothetical protein